MRYIRPWNFSTIVFRKNNILLIFLLGGLADSALIAIFTKSRARKARFVFPVYRKTKIAKDAITFTINKSLLFVATPIVANASSTVAIPRLVTRTTFSSSKICPSPSTLDSFDVKVLCDVRKWNYWQAPLDTKPKPCNLVLLPQQ